MVNAYIASGRSGFTTIGNAKRFHSDTGIIDSDAFREYLQRLGTIYNPNEVRIKLLAN